MINIKNIGRDLKLKDLSNISVVKKILKDNNFNFSKNFGQNFIVDPLVCPHMANACLNSNSDGVIEIGPGIGTLTVELAERFKKVVSIEIDKRLIPILSENLSDFDNVEIIQNDILKTDINEIVKSKFYDCEQVSICANLPYYITSEIIMYILENEFKINSIVVMIQKEAAERICAMPGTRQSGAISMAVRYFGNPEILFDVDRDCFIPSPNVDSSVIKITMDKNSSKDVKNRKTFFKVVKAAYSQRRKNLSNSLSSGLGIAKGSVSKLLEFAKIDSNIRAENLRFTDFVNISNLLFDDLN